MSIINRSVTYPNLTNLMTSPFDPSGWYGQTTDVDGSIINEDITNPSGIGFMGVAEQTGAGFFIMSSSEVNPLPVVIGDVVHLCILFRQIDNELTIQFRFADSTGFLAAARYSTMTGDFVSGSGFDFKKTILGDGFILLEVKFTAPNNDAALEGGCWMIAQSGSGVAPIGSKMYVQSVFFGKSDEFPALVKTGAEPVKTTIRPLIKSTVRNTNTF